MTENKNLPAFPQSCAANETGVYLATAAYAASEAVVGLSKRELIAAMCLQGLCASDFRGSMEAFARKSVEAADALLTELSKS